MQINSFDKTDLTGVEFMSIDFYILFDMEHNRSNCQGHPRHHFVAKLPVPISS